MKLIIIIALVLLALAAGPLLMIWSLNTLFPTLAIPYTLETWAASIILGGLISSRIKG